MERHSLAEGKRFGFEAVQFHLVVATSEPPMRIWKKLGPDVIGTLRQAFKYKALGLVDAFVRDGSSGFGRAFA